jgi:hypothetical protein
MSDCTVLADDCNRPVEVLLKKNRNERTKSPLTPTLIYPASPALLLIQEYNLSTSTRNFFLTV